jgi:hypothetical protein
MTEYDGINFVLIFTVIEFLALRLIRIVYRDLETVKTMTKRGQ